ncbi:hypothetical protein [Rubinisphaera sp.]|nr:hypothetical protein [Rubinisphaera sp.]
MLYKDRPHLVIQGDKETLICGGCYRDSSDSELLAVGSSRLHQK